MIFKSLISILFTLALTATVYSQNNTDSDISQTILFRITHPDLNNTSYLFGTHHAFGKTFFDSLFHSNEALTSCDILIKENLNIPGHTAEEIINNRTVATKWERYLNSNDLGFVKRLFAMSPTDFNKMTPTEMYVFLNRYFKQYVCLLKKSDDSSLSLDDYIGFKAYQQHMELVGLETTEEQIELINYDVKGMPRKNHKKRLSNIIEKIRVKNNNDCSETDWYYQMEIDYQLDEPCVNKLVLTDRNTKWIKTIVEQLKHNSCFIAVGLSHLMYDCGLINQLREFGYNVEPISAK